MKPIRIVKSPPLKEAKVVELEAKKKLGETDKDWKERIEAKLHLFLERSIT